MIWLAADAEECKRVQHARTKPVYRRKPMTWILRMLLMLPALIATGLSYDTLGPVVTIVSVVAIIGFAVVATGWTIRRDPY